MPILVLAIAAEGPLSARHIAAIYGTIGPHPCDEQDAETMMRTLVAMGAVISLVEDDKPAHYITNEEGLAYLHQATRYLARAMWTLVEWDAGRSPSPLAAIASAARTHGASVDLDQCTRTQCPDALISHPLLQLDVQALLPGPASAEEGSGSPPGPVAEKLVTY